MTDGVSVFWTKFKRMNWPAVVVILLIPVIFHAYNIAYYAHMQAPVSAVINGMPGQEIKAASHLMTELGLIEIRREGKERPLMYGGKTVALGSYVVTAMHKNHKLIVCHSGLTPELDVGATSFSIAPVDAGIEISVPLFSDDDPNKLRPERLRDVIVRDIAICALALSKNPENFTDTGIAIQRNPTTTR